MKGLVHHGLANLTLPVLSSLETIRVGLVVEKSFGDVLLGGEDKRTVLDDRLIKRDTSDEGLSEC
jgi:hypothetical protein